MAYQHFWSWCSARVSMCSLGTVLLCSHDIGLLFSISFRGRKAKVSKHSAIFATKFSKEDTQKSSSDMHQVPRWHPDRICGVCLWHFQMDVWAKFMYVPRKKRKEKQDVGAGEQLAICNCVLCHALDHPYFKLPKRGLL